MLGLLGLEAARVLRLPLRPWREPGGRGGFGCSRAELAGGTRPAQPLGCPWALRGIEGHQPQVRARKEDPWKQWLKQIQNVVILAKSE